MTEQSLLLFLSHLMVIFSRLWEAGWLAQEMGIKSRFESKACVPNHSPTWKQRARMLTRNKWEGKGKTTGIAEASLFLWPWAFYSSLSSLIISSLPSVFKERKIHFFQNLCWRAVESGTEWTVHSKNWLSSSSLCLSTINVFGLNF